MICIDNTIISDDVVEKHFVCDLLKCKGACCEAGDLGAPLEEEELGLIDDVLDKVLPYLTDAAKNEIAQNGAYIHDFEGDFSTSTVHNKECVFALRDDKGILKCAFEQAYLEGVISFRKPISCHLYPIRITKYDEYDAINYHRWDICSPACCNGASLKVELYKFLKDPLIRKYGSEWYKKLEYQAFESKK